MTTAAHPGRDEGDGAQTAAVEGLLPLDRDHAVATCTAGMLLETYGDRTAAPTSRIEDPRLVRKKTSGPSN